MSIHLVDIHEVTHTCPGDPTPHVVDTWRRVVHVTPGRACLAPVTIRVGTTTATIPCGRHEPADQQCGSCRTIITIRRHTTRHLTEVTA